MQMPESNEIAVDVRISENVNTLLWRNRMSAAGLARAIGLSKAGMSRKMQVGPWHYREVRMIADLFGVTTDQIADGLPPAAGGTTEERSR